MKQDPKNTSGRAFVRSLNILLKFARLYGYDHARTMEQIDTAWEELRGAMPPGSESGLLLGATGAQLLLDGVPLEGSPAEKQFASLLSTAGLASIQFSPSVSQDELIHFVQAFPTGKAKPSELAQQLKTALATARGIRINEIFFVATDARLKDASVAAQLAAAALGDKHQDFTKWLNDPQKLLELIAAAQGSRTEKETSEKPAAPKNPAPATNREESFSKGPWTPGTAASGYSSSSISQDGGSVYDSAPLETAGSGEFIVPSFPVVRMLRTGEPTEDELYSILSALTSFGQLSGHGGEIAAASAFQAHMAELPGTTRDKLKQAIAGLATQNPVGKPDESVLVQLAEHLAIRFALERFEQGEVKVNAVRQMLDRMNSEIENLRKILGVHEDKMSDAGMLVESHREILDRQFWAAVPDSGKREVLLSGEAWCIPAKNVQSFVSDLIAQGNVAEAISILQNYAACTESEDSDARKKTAVGLSEMADLYAKADPQLLAEALRHLGLRLNVEQDADLQGLVSAAFVRLSQEAATSRCYPAMEQALDLLVGVEATRPGVGRSLRSKMGIEERVPEFVDEALKARQAAAGLTRVLRQLPEAAIEQLASRFNRCSLRDDSEHISNLAHDMGEEGLQYLRSALRAGPVAEAVEIAGLLTKLDPQAVQVFLPSRIKDFPKTAQDRIVRQISSCGAPERCAILLALIDHVHPFVIPLVIDEVGVTGDREAIGRLLTIVDGDLPTGSGPYVQVKAIEALGHIVAPEAIPTLQRIVVARKVFGWIHPQEMRIAAMQTLSKLAPDWFNEFWPKSGVDDEEMVLAPLEVVSDSKFVRQRRHTRVRLRKPVRAISTNLKENCSMDIKTASLTGGVATISRHLAPGTQVQLRLQTGLRNLQVTAMMRDYRAEDMAFEIVDMSLDERNKYRRLLVDNRSATKPAEGTKSAAPADAEMPVAR
ncbi:MAG TPA: hypothetical protein VE545_02690 [Candidatus Dormibacteraeota bacterium]|nr:hypothetical protein [Candidatus Dormibacteraeota bacterium]